MITDCIGKIIHKKTRIGVGVMSGTSLDGIDVAFCSITGCGTETCVKLLHFETIPYAPDFRARLLSVCDAEKGRVDEVCLLNKQLGVEIGKAIVQAAGRAGISMDEVDFVSSHGQTVQHIPEAGATLQIGELADIAAITDTVTVGDFRPSDMAYGGQGAPLVPYVDYLLYRSSTVSRILINIGGIANLTALKKNAGQQDIVAFDTGPGNVLMDHLVRLHTGGARTYDRDGVLASRGQSSDTFLADMIKKDPFPSLTPPRSTGREHYTAAFAERLLERGQDMGLSFEDILATVTDYTALVLASAVKRFVSFQPDEIYVSGGGYQNRYLRDRLEKRFSHEVLSVEALGVSGDAKEAVAFVVLGNEMLSGNANNIPAATGASRPVVMGKLALPSGTFSFGKLKEGDGI